LTVAANYGRTIFQKITRRLLIMKTMRKILALVLCVMLMAAIVPSAYAQNPGTGGDGPDTPPPTEYVSDEKMALFVIGNAGCTHDIGKVTLPFDPEEKIPPCHTFVSNVSPVDDERCALSGNGWSYDVPSRTLTLNGFSGSGIFARTVSSAGTEEEIILNIKLTGENTLNGSPLASSWRQTIEVEGSVTIHGPGSLTVTNTKANTTGIYARTARYVAHGSAQKPIAGRVRISSGATVRTTTYGNGFAGAEMIIDSGCVVIANTVGADAYSPVNVSHIRCNGTIKATSGNTVGPTTFGRGIVASMFYTAGPNVTAYSGTSEHVAVARTITYPTRETMFGNDVGSWDSSTWAAYMAMVESGAATPPPPATDPIDSASGWAKEGITAALAKGFVPNDIQGSYTNTITRAEFCRMAVKWLEYKLGKDINAIVAEKGIAARASHTFSDTTDPAILAAYRLGVTAGSVSPTATAPGQFNPSGQFTRLEAAMMIMNACGVSGMDVSNATQASFADMNQAASWAHPGINFVHANGIMSGDGTNFLPAQTYSREQSILTFNNIP
jgi:hypothetical protein